ncbi:MAG: SDR family oxidoreductase [Bifidobacteriaceae bacterium]|jgi:3-oxoacyl-[acyl-carrier protein] reductase|nr:SDR family oxidoreductase [Bifidobacteriaceae bacterium]
MSLQVNLPDFRGRTAVVTGGANGIGAAIVKTLTDKGAEVLVLDLEESASSRSYLLDLAAETEVLRGADYAIRLLGRVDVLVNCAGMVYCSSLTDLELAGYRETLAVMLDAPVILMREFGRRMVESGYGRIVNVSSIHSQRSEPRTLSYDAAKAALEAVTRSAAVDLAASGILVNAVAPGFVATRMSIVEGADELESDWFRSIYLEHGRLPLGRAATPEEVAVPVAWLASSANTYITGQVITVDGGLSARL